MRESYTSIVARIDECLKNLKEDNAQDHKDIKGSIVDLKNHVNDELQKFDLRVKKCEDNDKTEAVIYKVVITILGVALTVVSILGYFKLI